MAAPPTPRELAKAWRAGSPLTRQLIEQRIEVAGISDRFIRGRDGSLLARITEEERIARRGADANPRIKPIELSDEQRDMIGFGLSPEGQRNHDACRKAILGRAA